VISQKTAEKLKAAGLKHLITIGDGVYREIGKEDVWLPRLDELMAEIEGRGYVFTIASANTPEGNHMAETIKTSKFIDEENKIYLFSLTKKEHYAHTPEDAAGQALLWVLEQEIRRPEIKE